METLKINPTKSTFFFNQPIFTLFSEWSLKKSGINNPLDGGDFATSPDLAG